jgi:hypothetical protein
MCPFRISALSQPTLGLPGTSVPETILWSALPDEVRSRAVAILAELLARHGTGEAIPARQDDRARGAGQSVAGQRGGCR